MLITTCCPVCGSSKLSKTPAVVMPFISYRIFGWKPLVISDESGMRSLENGSSYQLCATTYCEECTLVFCDVRFDDGEMGRLYKDYREEEYVTQAIDTHYRRLKWLSLQMLRQRQKSRDSHV